MAEGAPVRAGGCLCGAVRYEVGGSTLFWQGAGRDYISIAAGTLDDSSGLAIACHIFVDDKGSYYEINDGTPQHRGGTFAVRWP